MRLRAGLRVLWRSRDEVQVGTDPRWAVRFTDLLPGEVDLLMELGAGGTTRSLAPRARTLGVPADRLGALVALLGEAQLLTRTQDLRRRKAPLAPGAGSDVATWTRVLADADGAGLLAARRRGVVGLVGAGRLGLSATVALAAAGIGTVLVDDEQPVTAADLGIGGYTARDLGLPRRAAAARVLRDVAPEVRTTAPEGTRPDVVVLVEHGAADALRARALMSAAIVHLSVVVREADVVVGPLVRPGDSPCLRCLDLHRTDADPRWPAVASQLVSLAPAHGGDEETMLAAIAGALAAGQVLAQVDGTGPATLGAALEVGLPEAVPRLRRWTTHPTCGCASLPAN